MFYLLILVSIVGYSLQGTLIASFSRRLDPLSLAVYRNASLIVTMLPLLLMAAPGEIIKLVEFYPVIITTGISGTLGIAVMFRSVLYLPVGIASGIRQAAGVLLSLLLGFLIFGEEISLFRWLAIVVLLTGVMIISTSRNPMPHLDANTVKGLILSLISGGLIAFSFFLMGKLARDLDPAISGYFLEASIGLCSLIMISIRRLVTGRGFEPASFKTLLGIAAVSSPTLLGTGAAAWAITLGPFGIMRAYSAAGVLITVLISTRIYGEHLRLNQWIGIVTTVFAVIALRLG